MRTHQSQLLKHRKSVPYDSEHELENTGLENEDLGMYVEDNKAGDEDDKMDDEDDKVDESAVAILPNVSL